MKNQLIIKSMHPFLFIGALMCFIISCNVSRGIEPNGSKLVYHVYEHRQDREILTVSLILPEPAAGNTLLFTRGMKLGIKPPIFNVRCGGKTVRQDADNKWVIPKGSREIVWEVRLVSSRKSLMDISRQQSFIIRSDPPWILLSEFSFLPRIEAGHYESVIEFEPSLEKKVVSSLDRDGENRLILPDLNQAPAFFVIGLDAHEYKSPSGISLNYLVDEKAATEKIDSFLPMHIRSIEYMRSFLKSPDNRDFKLTVLWLGLSPNGTIGGAAGFRTFLINYFFIDGKVLQDRFIWSLMVAFHEQFHVLYNSKASQPVWVGESLAQYYAIKTLEKVGFAPDIIKKIKEHFIRSSGKIEMGLLEANRRFRTKNDMSVYHLFYDQGASFWFELDELIMHKTRGKKSLDDFIGALSQMNFNEDGSLPAEFISMLKSNNIKGIKPLIGKYL